MSKLVNFKQMTVPSSSRVISPAYSSKEDFEQLVVQATPLYKERLSSVPFYKDRMQDVLFWTQFVSSRVLEARVLVEASTKAKKLKSIGRSQRHSL